ncbi:MAG: HlyD family efflux transporter periplasmic adaptor subunit [Bacteroidetes bacterium]|nr:HlyD family efflux transporter periplasmic adaptor subunit [Bacteroidota bacterium]
MIKNKRTAAFRRTMVYGLILITALAAGGCNRAKPIHATHKTITEAVYASGFVAARNLYKVYALTDGNILAKYHVAGDSVGEGDALYRIQSDASSAKLTASSSAYKLAIENAQDNSPIIQDLDIKIKSAETVLANDQSTYNRMKSMYDAGAVSRTQLDQASTALEVSKNNLASARETYTRTRQQLKVDAQNAQALVASSGQDLSNYVLKALIKGRVYETYKELGEAVKRNDAVALIGESGSKYLQLAVDQQDIGKVKVGQEVVVKMDIASDKVYKAKVTKIYPNMNANNQSFRVDADFIDDPGLQFINASVEANIVLATKENALVLPRQAVTAKDEVLVKSLGSTKTVKVKKGLVNMSDVEVLEGVSDQDEIVLPKD